MIEIAGAARDGGFATGEAASGTAATRARRRRFVQAHDPAARTAAPHRRLTSSVTPLERSRFLYL
jgi:hypothetical protein